MFPMIFFWIVFAIDAIAALTVFYFFLEGLGDGSVSSFNMALWVALLGGVIAIVGGGAVLNVNGRRRTSIAVLSILGIPAVAFGLFILLIVITRPNWH
jgi:hypothetical protein